MSGDRSNLHKHTPLEQQACRSSISLSTSIYATASTETYDGLADSVSQLSLNEVSAAWGYDLASFTLPPPIQVPVPDCSFNLSTLVSRFPSDISSNHPAQFHISDVTAQAVCQSVNHSVGCLRPASWGPHGKQQRRLRSQSNEQMNALARQLKHTSLADPKARKARKDRVVRTSRERDGDFHIKAKPHYKMSGLAAVPVTFADGSIGDEVSQHAFGAGHPPSQPRNHIKNWTDAEYLALVEEVYGDEEDSDDEDDGAAYEYHHLNAPWLRSIGSNSKDVNLGAYEASHIDAHTFPVGAGNYEDEDTLTVYSTPAHVHASSFPDVAYAAAYLTSQYRGHLGSFTAAEDDARMGAEGEWGPSSTSSEDQGSDYSMDAYSDDEDL